MIYISFNLFVIYISFNLVFLSPQLCYIDSWLRLKQAMASPHAEPSWEGEGPLGQPLRAVPGEREEQEEKEKNR